MSLNVIDGRIVEKVSTVPGEIPTIGPSQDHTDGTWVPSDVYEAEFFVNVTDQKIYILMDGTIVELTTGGPVPIPTLEDVLTAGNTTGANNIILGIDQNFQNASGNAYLNLGYTGDINDVDLYGAGDMYLSADGTSRLQSDIEVNILGGTKSQIILNNTAAQILYIDSLNTSKTLYNATQVNTSSTDGTDTSNIIVEPDNVTISVDPSVGTTNAIIIDNTDIQMSANTDISITANEQVHIKGQSTGFIKEINMESGYQEIKTTGTTPTNISKVQVSDTSVVTTSTDGTDSTNLEVRPAQVLSQVSSGTIDNIIDVDNSDILVSSNNTSTSTLSRIQVSDASIQIHSETATDAMELVVEPTQVYIQDSAATTILFQVNEVGAVLPEFFTPTSSADTTGVQGQLTLDDNYIYVKTSAGWKRSALTAF